MNDAFILRGICFVSRLVTKHHAITQCTKVRNKNIAMKTIDEGKDRTHLPPSASVALKVCSFTVCLDVSTVLRAMPYKYMVESMYDPFIVS